MQAICFEQTLQVIELAQPEPAEDEVLIRLRLAGICNTDLELMRGYKEFSGILGHEFVGEVVQGPTEWMGQRVVGEINISCGACDLCQRGLPSQCRVRRTLGLSNYDGAFAHFFRLPVRNLWAVPAHVSDEVAVFTEPLAAACQVLEAVHIQPDDHVIVIGAGKLGLLVAQVLRLIGGNLEVIVRRERQAALLAGLGIRALPRDQISDHKADVVVDCTGSAGGFADALTLVRPRGTIILKSTYADLPQIDLTQVAVNEIRVVGSRCGPFGTALRLMTRDLVDVRPLIEARFELVQAARAFELAAQPGMLKVLLRP